MEQITKSNNVFKTKREKQLRSDCTPKSYAYYCPGPFHCFCLLKKIPRTHARAHSHGASKLESWSIKIEETNSASLSTGTAPSTGGIIHHTTEREIHLGETHRHKTGFDPWWAEGTTATTNHPRPMLGSWPIHRLLLSFLHKCSSNPEIATSFLISRFSFSLASINMF